MKMGNLSSNCPLFALKRTILIKHTSLALDLGVLVKLGVSVSTAPLLSLDEVGVGVHTL